jgi:hypothetical protein
LLKLVKRHYGHIQNIPRHPSFVSPLGLAQTLQVFQDFMIHVIPLVQQGPMVTDQWQHVSRLDTLQIIQNVNGMEEEGMRDGDSVEYFQDLLRRMQDEM